MEKPHYKQVKIHEFWHNEGKMIDLDFPLVCDSTTDDLYERLMSDKMKAQPKSPQTGDNTFFITLTCTTNLTDLLIRLKRILKAKMFSIIYAEGCIELTKQDKPHAHLFVRTSKKYLDKAKLHRSNKDMVDLQRPKSDENVLNYIKKQDTKPSLEYLNKYGINYPYFKYTQKEIQFVECLSQNEDFQSQKLSSAIVPSPSQSASIAQ